MLTITITAIAGTQGPGVITTGATGDIVITTTTTIIKQDPWGCGGGCIAAELAKPESAKGKAPPPRFAFFSLLAGIIEWDNHIEMAQPHADGWIVRDPP